MLQAGTLVATVSLVSVTEREAHRDSKVRHCKQQCFSNGEGRQGTVSMAGTEARISEFRGAPAGEGGDWRSPSASDRQAGALDSAPLSPSHASSTYSCPCTCPTPENEPQSPQEFQRLEEHSRHGLACFHSPWVTDRQCGRC